MDEQIKWTNLGRPKIAKLLAAEGINISVTVVDQLLKNHHYRRRRMRKTLSTGAHTQRNEQFENCDSIYHWWTRHGQFDYPEATSILLLCDDGGSNGSRYYIIPVP